jgi:hypothetical protein
MGAVSGCIVVSLVCRSGGGVPHSDGAAEGPLRLCRNTALHYASMNGHTETAKAVVKVGADVDCKNTYG